MDGPGVLHWSLSSPPQSYSGSFTSGAPNGYGIISKAPPTTLPRSSMRGLHQGSIEFPFVFARYNASVVAESSQWQIVGRTKVRVCPASPVSPQPALVHVRRIDDIILASYAPMLHTCVGRSMHQTRVPYLWAVWHRRLPPCLHCTALLVATSARSCPLHTSASLRDRRWALADPKDDGLGAAAGGWTGRQHAQLHRQVHADVCGASPARASLRAGGAVPLRAHVPQVSSKGCVKCFFDGPGFASTRGKASTRPGSEG
jgi:hypothetical protein